jgi:5-methylcytosine-specific restriction enzyme subunit McrC
VGLTTAAPSGKRAPVVVDIEEFGTCDLSADLFLDGTMDSAPDRANLEKFFTARLAGRQVKLQAKGHVGLIPVNPELSLNVTPRVRLTNLARMLEVSGYSPEGLPTVLRTYRRDGRLFPSVISAYADGLRRFIDETDHNGLMKDYVREEELSSFPHGRVLIDRTMRRQAVGANHQAWTSSFRRTADIPSNQCVLYAIHVLARANSRMHDDAHALEARRVAELLNYCASRLSAVSLVHPQDILGDPMVSGRVPVPALRSYYRGGLELSKAIIKGEGIDFLLPAGDLSLHSMLIDMSDVFERYVRQVILSHSSREKWGLSILDGNFGPPRGAAKGLFDSGVFIGATPDVVVRDDHGSFPVVVEVKYVPASGNPERTHIDQTLAYGLAYRAPNLVIVQPRGPAGGTAGLRKIGRIQDLAVWQYVIDLDASDTEKEEDAMAVSIRSLAGYGDQQTPIAQ